MSKSVNTKIKPIHLLMAAVSVMLLAVVSVVAFNAFADDSGVHKRELGRIYIDGNYTSVSLVTTRKKNAPTIGGLSLNDDGKYFQPSTGKTYEKTYDYSYGCYVFENFYDDSEKYLFPKISYDTTSQEYTKFWDEYAKSVDVYNYVLYRDKNASDGVFKYYLVCKGKVNKSSAKGCYENGNNPDIDEGCSVTFDTSGKTEMSDGIYLYERHPEALEGSSTAKYCYDTSPFSLDSTQLAKDEDFYPYYFKTTDGISYEKWPYAAKVYTLETKIAYTKSMKYNSEGKFSFTEDDGGYFYLYDDDINEYGQQEPPPYDQLVFTSGSKSVYVDIKALGNAGSARNGAIGTMCSQEGGGRITCKSYDSSSNEFSISGDEGVDLPTKVEVFYDYSNYVDKNGCTVVDSQNMNGEKLYSESSCDYYYIKDTIIDDLKYSSVKLEERQVINKITGNVSQDIQSWQVKDQSGTVFDLGAEARLGKIFEPSGVTKDTGYNYEVNYSKLTFDSATGYYQAIEYIEPVFKPKTVTIIYKANPLDTMTVDDVLGMPVSQYYTGDKGTSMFIVDATLLTKGYALADPPSTNKDNITCKGWATDTTGTGPIVTTLDSSYLKERNDGSGEFQDIEVSAIWESLYNVTYEVSGTIPDGYSKPADTTHAHGDNVDVEAVPSGYDTAKYTFTGWTTTDVEVKNGSFTMPDKDVTFTGEFTENVKVTLTYISNGGTPENKVPKAVSNYPTFTETVSAPQTDFGREGYNFTGWNTAANGSGTAYAVGSTISVAADTQLYAQWAKNNYTVTYKDGYTNDSTNDRSITVAYEDAHTVRDNMFTRIGYHFTGWDVTPTTYSKNAGDTIAVKDDVTYVAQWEKNNYYVEYYKADGTTSISAKLYEYEATVTVGEGVTAPPIDGYTFKNWAIMDDAQTDANGDVIGTADSFPMPAETVKYKAVYDAIEYHVTYVVGGTIPDGYSEPVDNNVYHYGDTVNVAAIPSESEYSFTGWSYAGETYGAGTANESFTITSDATLSGEWTYNGPQHPDKVRIIYTSGMADVSVHPSLVNEYTDEVTYGNDYTVKNNDGFSNYVRPGYTFKCWKQVANKFTGFSLIDNLLAKFTASGIGDTYNAGDVIPALSESITLEAQWEAEVYHVTYNGNGNTAGTAPIDSTDYNYNDNAAVKDKGTLEKTGATFDHWNTAANDTGTSYKAGDHIVMTADVTLYAIWKADPDPTPYIVHYDGNGNTAGTAPADREYLSGTSVTVEPKGDLERTNYTFKEWNTKPNGKGTGYAPGGTFTMPERNVTLYAIWVDKNGNVPSPGTGEGMLGIWIAVVTMLASTGGVFYAVSYRRKRETA